MGAAAGAASNRVSFSVIERRPLAGLAQFCGETDIKLPAHGERFRGVLPANTLVRTAPVGEAYLVEMEAEAVLSQ